MKLPLIILINNIPYCHFKYLILDGVNCNAIIIKLFAKHLRTNLKFVSDIVRRLFHINTRYFEEVTLENRQVSYVLPVCTLNAVADSGDVFSRFQMENNRNSAACSRLVNR